MRTLLQAKTLRREIPDGRRLLDDVTFEVATGDRIVIQGAAGSGKTLLLRAVALLDPVTSGNVFWRGNPVPDQDVPRYRSRVTYLAQAPALVEGTVETNFRLPFSLELYSDLHYDEDRVLELLLSVGRDDSFLAQPVSALSGGERQVVALVRLLQLDPQVLLLDEPTAALDPEATQMVQHLIIQWSDSVSEERAFLWVSHDDSQADQVSTRLIRMHEGKLT